MSEIEPVTESPPEQPSKDKPTAQTKPSTAFANILSVIAVVLVAGLGYLYYQDRTNQQSDSDRFLQQQQSANQQHQALTEQLTMQIQTMQKRLADNEAAQQAALTGLADQLNASNARMAELNGQNQRSWYLDEAHYLLRMANNRIIFLQDLKSARLLIDQADTLLARIDNVELFSVRQKLAEDRQRLAAVPPVDETGTAIRLGAIQGRVDQLPLQKFLYQQEEQVAVEQPVATTWYEHLAGSMAKLGEQWFEVRRHSPGYNPLMTEAEAQQLRYVVLLTVQTAQFAVLHQDGDLYQASLLQLRSRLNSYFDTEDPEVQTVLSELANLLEIPVISEPVEGLHSLSLLQDFIQTMRQPDTETQS